MKILNKNFKVRINLVIINNCYNDKGGWKNWRRQVNPNLVTKSGTLINIDSTNYQKQTQIYNLQQGKDFTLPVPTDLNDIALSLPFEKDYHKRSNTIKDIQNINNKNNNLSIIDKIKPLIPKENNNELT